MMSRLTLLAILGATALLLAGSLANDEDAWEEDAAESVDCAEVEKQCAAIVPDWVGKTGALGSQLHWFVVREAAQSFPFVRGSPPLAVELRGLSSDVV